MAATPIVVTGNFLRPDGSGAAAEVLFALQTEVFHSGGPSIHATEPLRGVLDGDGNLKAADGVSDFVVLATDDPGTSPRGTRYRVTIMYDTAKPRVFYVAIPYNSPGATLDLSAVLLYDVPGATGAWSFTTDDNLVAWALDELWDFALITTFVAGTNNLLPATGTIVWTVDGATGTFLSLTHTSAPVRQDTYQLTHTPTGKTVTVGPPVVDGSGNVISAGSAVVS